MLAIIVQDTGRRFFQGLKTYCPDAVLCVLFPAGELIDAALQQPSVVPVFHFKIMTGGCLVVDAIAEIRECAGFRLRSVSAASLLSRTAAAKRAAASICQCTSPELSAVGLNKIRQ